MALTDQAIVSGINFLTAVVLARHLPPTAYGYYVLLFAILLFVNGLQTAFITAPLMVFLPCYQAPQATRYLNSLSVIQVVGCAITIVVAIGYFILAKILGLDAARVFSAAPLILVVTTYLTQEFARRVLFAQGDSLGGSLVDVISYGLQVAGLAGLIALGRLTLDSALWTIGVTSLLGSAFGFIRARVSLFSVTRSDVMGTWREHWSHGQWLASGTLAQWGSSQLSYFVVAAMLSPAATALFAASRNILGFTHVFLNGLENFVPNMMTRRLMDSGLGAMIRWLNRFQILTTALMTTYCIVIAVLAKPLLHVAFGDQYADAPKIVVLVAVSYLVIGLIRPLTIAVRVLGEPRWIFLAHLAAAIISLPLSAALIHVGGVFGAAISLIVAQVIAFIGVGFGYRRAVARARTARSAEDARTDESLAAAENAVA